MNMHKKAQKILDTTVRLLLRDGVKKTTMDDIAESASVSKVTVYKYFTDKDTLYLEVGKTILAEHSAQLSAIAALRAPLFAKFGAALECISAFADSGKFALCGELAACNPAVDTELARHRETYRSTLYTLIEEGMAAGRMNPRLTRDMIFLYIDMGVAYYQQNEAYRGKMRGDSAFQKRFMEFFIGNIGADGTASLAEE